MIQRYTIDDVHGYTQDVLDVQRELSNRMPFMSDTAIKEVETQLHVMREVVLRMHESLLKHGPIRPSLLARWLTTREIRKIWARTTDEPPKISDLELQRISEEISRKARRADEAAAAVMGRPRK